MATKTNAVRLVQQAGIPCREAFYEFDEQDLSAAIGQMVAHRQMVIMEQMLMLPASPQMPKKNIPK